MNVSLFDSNTFCLLSLFPLCQLTTKSREKHSFRHEHGKLLDLESRFKKCWTAQFHLIFKPQAHAAHCLDYGYYIRVRVNSLCEVVLCSIVTPSSLRRISLGLTFPAESREGKLARITLYQNDESKPWVRAHSEGVTQNHLSSKITPRYHWKHAHVHYQVECIYISAGASTWTLVTHHDSNAASLL